MYVEWIKCLYTFGQVIPPLQKCNNNHPRNKRPLEKIGKLIQLSNITWFRTIWLNHDWGGNSGP